MLAEICISFPISFSLVLKCKIVTWDIHSVFGIFHAFLMIENIHASFK